MHKNDTLLNILEVMETFEPTVLIHSSSNIIEILLYSILFQSAITLKHLLACDMNCLDALDFSPAAKVSKHVVQKFKISLSPRLKGNLRIPSR